MFTGAGLFSIVIAATALARISGRYLSQRKLLQGRQPLALAEIVNDLPETVRRDEASEVLQVIGKSFGVPREILRLSVPQDITETIDILAGDDN